MIANYERPANCENYSFKKKNQHNRIYYIDLYEMRLYKLRQNHPFSAT